jgi:threonine aldolase
LDPKAKVYDFRSDTVTAPTDEMFDIMKSASRGDDVFQVSSFECKRIFYWRY